MKVHTHQMLRTMPYLIALFGLLMFGMGCGGSDDGESGASNGATSNSTSSNGTTSNGTTATSNGTTATSNGTTATSNGTTATSNGTTATSNGTTATSNGTTSTSNGTINCPDIGCAEDCPNGFEADENGCQTCVCLPGVDDERTCRESGGIWDERSCGDYVCGNQPECEAIIPGCDCGSGASFDSSRGCYADPDCGDDPPPEVGLCEDTGGRWDDGSCGHYACGERPTCRALIPGCDCGEGSNFVDGEGCVEDERCDLEEPGLCEDTGGRWDEGSCGHYECGMMPACRALIPGCDCGEDANFVPGEGCVDDRLCELDGAGLCEDTGGEWDDGSCGHYECGERPTCRALIPGCNCGEGANFIEGEGCVRDEVCAVGTPEALCEETDGRWDEGSCGHYECGMMPACRALIPGCDCGDDANFVEGEGCVDDRLCGLGEEGVCTETGGDWDDGSCGHYVCGERPTCRALIPGCNCGESSVFVPGEGCVEDVMCEDSDDDQALCEESNGRWDESSCGHYYCGQVPLCLALIPGCNCGDDANFEPGVGCIDDRACGFLEEEQLCGESGGEWDDGSCGHYVCGERPTCRALIPGCNCGEGAVYQEGRGCVESDSCTTASLCRETGGRWDPNSCGHYMCGQPPFCDAIVPGCDCGPEASFSEREGCMTDRECGGGGDCADLSAQLSEELYRELGACSVAVRLDYTTLDVIGYQVHCGRYNFIDEAQARRTAEEDTGYGEDSQALHMPDTEGMYVFYESPGDFGGVSAVSVNTGLTAFGGSIVWNGRGDIVYPERWRPAADLGSECGVNPPIGAPSIVGYDLVSGSSLAPEAMERPLAVVMDTVVMEAMVFGGYVFDAHVLLYPRTVGGFDESSAEWVVFINGGWLE